MRVLVLVLNYNGMHDTLECVRSLQRSSYRSFEILVIDNQSVNNSVSFLREQIPEVRLIETGGNLGYAGGNNVGLRIALKEGFDASLVLNNDTIIDSDCIARFVEMSKAYPDAILGGRLHQYHFPELLQHCGGVWNDKRAKFICHPRDFTDAKQEWNQIHSLDFVTGAALFVPRHILETVGLMEESFFLYYEEIDWCTQIKKAGFQCLYCPDAKIWHKESASFIDRRPPQMYFLTRNRLFYMQRNFSKTTFLHFLLVHFSYRALLLYAKRLFSLNRSSRRAYRAAVAGMHDFFRGKSGNAPKWVYTA